MNKIEVKLVADARHFYKWSSVRWQIFLVAIVAAAGHLPELLNHLPVVLDWLNQNWPQLQPFLARVFPSVSASNWVATAQVLAILLRVTSIERVATAPPEQTTPGAQP